MRGSDFIFGCVSLLYYKCHKINTKHGGLYINSTDQIKKKKATLNPKNDDYRCFQHAATGVLNIDKIKKDPQRVPNINFNWEGMNYPSKIEDQNRFEKNNLIIALNVLYIKEKEICPGYISKINLS